MNTEIVTETIDALLDHQIEMRQHEKGYFRYIDLQQTIRSKIKHSDESSINLEWLYEQMCECEVKE